MAEALGMALSGTTPVRAASENLISYSKRAGSQILELIEHDERPRNIVYKEAIQNAVCVAISIGCSVNTIRHISAVALEAGLDLDVVKTFEDEAENSV